MIRKIIGAMAIALAVAGMTGCGEKVEVPPAHVGKIMTKDGYQDNLIPTSKLRLDACWAYCDRLVVLDVADHAYQENLSIFIPEDKLNLGVSVKTTLSINPKKTAELFTSVPPTEQSSYLSLIESQKIYNTYASQIIQTETREYLSKFSIAEIASSNERINSELRDRLSKVVEQRTPFSVRYVGLTNIQYPQIIIAAQEASAERREAIQREEAQLQVSKVQLERELQEARMTRAIEKEKAETEAVAQRTLAESVDPRVLELKKLENQRAWIEKWQGGVPQTVLGDGANTMMMMNMGK